MSAWHRIVVLILTAALLLSATTGCKSAASDEVSLTEADDGVSITLKKGQVLAITLPARPTRGFRWDPRDIAIYEQLPMGLEQFRPDSNLPDYDGHQILRFEAKTRGQYDVNLIYRVVGSSDEPARTFNVTVTVE